MTTLSIGRRTDCDIVLPIETVSRMHARLYVLGDGNFAIEDCDSTSGTFLKSGQSWQKVHRANVTAEDVVKIGDLQIAVSELLAKAGRPIAAGDVVEARARPRPGSRFERDPETGLIREKK